jgi:hypothetical protein
MYLGDVVRRVLLKMAQEAALFGPNVPRKMLEAFSLGYISQSYVLWRSLFLKVMRWRASSGDFWEWTQTLLIGCCSSESCLSTPCILWMSHYDDLLLHQPLASLWHCWNWFSWPTVSCSTPDMSKMHADESSDLKVVGNVLRDVYGVCNLFFLYSTVPVVSSSF